MSSINTMTKFPIYFWNNVFIRHIKVVGALIRPNGMIKIRNVKIEFEKPSYKYPFV
jgi:hypothetical protein